MSKKKRSRRPAPRPSPSRSTPAKTPSRSAPAKTRTAAPARGGMFGSLFGGASLGPSPFGTIRTTLARGFVTTGASPFLVIFPFVAVLLYWSCVLMARVRMPPAMLFDAIALPPVGARLDFGAATMIGGPKLVIWLAVGITVVRSLAIALLAGVIVVSLEGDPRPTLGGLRRGIRAFPAVLGTNFGAFGVFAIATNLLPFLGGGIGMLGLFLIPAAMLFFLGFVPAIAARGRVSLSETLRRSIAAARLPGGRHFMFSFLYVAIALIGPQIIGAMGRDLAELTANPGAVSWVSILLAAYVHTAFLAAYCYRWMVVEDLVPAAAPRRRR